MSGAARPLQGLDCSGLIQTALQAAGIAAPARHRHDGAGIWAARSLREKLRRGDLVFWKGHMGVMRDSENLLHANAFHMQTVSEPLDVAIARIAKPVTAIKRL